MSKDQVIVEMPISSRLRLYNQVQSAMDKAGLDPINYNELDIGFELPAGWPVDIDAQPTLAELVVVSRKLGLQIVVGDVNLIPVKKK